MAAKHSVPKLVGSVLLCEAAGGIGSIFSNEGIRNWYPKLEKPSFTPPSWVFGPVWTLLYAMMGVSLYVDERERAEGSNMVPTSYKRTVVIRVLQAQISWLGARRDRVSLGCYSGYHRGLLEGF